MSTKLDPELSELKSETEKLLALLNNPEPGLLTWNLALGARVKSISQVCGKLLA